MPTPRQHKENHILYADAVGSTCKSGVWFTESDSFKGQQRAVLEAVKEKIDWVAAPQPGETEGFSPQRHLEVLARHAPKLALDVVL
ncbi:hypothetical protein AB0I84_36000, partial [Streptomyces spectabilis]